MPIPNPEPGLVISYAYLWRHEYRAGREEGQKDRPSVIVLAVEREADGATVVTALPITHSRPHDPASAVEIPLPVKRHLGSTTILHGSLSTRAMNFSGPAMTCESCRTEIATTTAFCRRDFSIRCSGPLWTGIEADGSSLLRVDNMTPVSQTHAARNHISNVTKQGSTRRGRATRRARRCG